MTGVKELEELVRKLMDGFAEGVETVLEDVAEKLRLSAGEEGDFDTDEVSVP